MFLLVSSFLGYLRVQLLDDVINLFISGLEIHSLSYILSTAFGVFFLRTLDRVSFAGITQDFTLFRKMSGAVQHAHFGPIRLVVRTVCIFSPEISGETLLRFGW